MEKLKNIFATTLEIPVDSVGSGMSKDNTPTWDSLSEIMIVTEIEKAFQIKFSYDEAQSIKTFEDVVTLLSSKGIDLRA